MLSNFEKKTKDGNIFFNTEKRKTINFLTHFLERAKKKNLKISKNIHLLIFLISKTILKCPIYPINYKVLKKQLITHPNLKQEDKSY